MARTPDSSMKALSTLTVPPQSRSRCTQRGRNRRERLTRILAHAFVSPLRTRSRPRRGWRGERWSGWPALRLQPQPGGGVLLPEVAGADIATDRGDAAPATLAHDRPLRGALQGGLRGAAGAQRVISNPGCC